MEIGRLKRERDGLARELRALLDAEDYDTARGDELCARIEEIDRRLRHAEAAAREDAAIEAAAIEAAANAVAAGPRPLDAVCTSGRASPLIQYLRGEIRADMGTQVGPEGGFLVPEQVAGRIIDRLRAVSPVRAVATVLRASAGGDLRFPTSDGTAEEGEIVAENQPASRLDPTFGAVVLKTFKYSSRTIAVPIELLQDSAVDIEAFVINRMADRLARITNRHFTTGDGQEKPRGLQSAAQQGVVGANGTGQVTSVSYDSLVDLQHSVDPAYRQAAGDQLAFMMSDAALASVRKIKDSSGRPIFVPGYETGVPGGAPDRLLGNRLVINQAMPAMAANARSILFGDFSYYVIRDVLDVTVRRYTDSAFDINGQVGFLTWLRTGGVLTEPAAVRFFQNAAS